MIKDNIYIVDWVDSSHSLGWKTKDELRPDIQHCRTVGYFVSENDEAICMAQSIAIANEYAPYAELISIPKVCIQKSIELEV